jgi:hypothetical protein
MCSTRSPRCFRAFFDDPVKRIAQLAGRLSGRVLRPQGPRGLPGRQRPAHLRETQNCPEREFIAGHLFFEGIILMEMDGKSLARSQDKRKLLSEARAAPPPIFGTMINSSTVTFESST